MSKHPPAPASMPDQGTKHSVYQIGGIQVEFPHKAYGSQLAFMGRVISTLDRAQRQGHCNALLESPTGTGKTLSLLCSALAWQKCFLSRYPSPAPPSSLAVGASVGKDGQPQVSPDGSDPFVVGGGFIPEAEPSEDPSKETSKGGAQQKRAPPTIYYASRTHAQLSQVVSEFRKTSYRVRMAILASRKHYCTNKEVCASDNVNENCKKLLKDEGLGCVEFKNANKVKDHPSIKKGGRNEVHDIEDLVKVGISVKGCSYFGALSIASEAELVFCPYSYVINPLIRKAMDIDLKGDILIVDEAHNIEDMTREAASMDVDEEILHRLQQELGELSSGSVANRATYQPLHDMIQEMLCWINRRANGLQYHDFEHYSSCWTGSAVCREFADFGVTLQNFAILEGCAKKAIKDYTETGKEGGCLSGVSANALEGLFCSLSYFFMGSGLHATDYQLVLQRRTKKDQYTTKCWTNSLSLWCLNPAVVFKEISDLSLSVVLTSGTLSPMGSFASELGVPFEVCMEAPHVINAESQLFAAVVSRGCGNQRLNASYKTADGFGFQDELGLSLEEICNSVPGGVLVFFPSYKLLEKLHARWCQTGQWSRLNAQKPFFIEPRSNSDEFESVLKDYYQTIKGNKFCSNERTKRGRKRDLKRPQGPHTLDSTKIRGAAFLAVCRGKVSEGVNFSDENARAVVIVGIPFPNINDLQVSLKKKYNDTHKSCKSLLSGSDWYCHQAFRALNQAAGRCIRHRFDYGAIIFLDERLQEERNLAYISKWIKQSIKQLDTFDMLIQKLRCFFKTKEMESEDTTIESRSLNNDGDNMRNIEQQVNDDKAPTVCEKPKKMYSQNGRRKNFKQMMLYSQKEMISDLTNLAATVGSHPSQHTANIIIDDDILSPVETETASKSKTPISKSQKSYKKECIDLECHMQAPPRWPPSASCIGHSDHGSLVEDSVVRNLSDLSATEAMFNDGYDLMNWSCFDSDSASNSNDIISEHASVVVCSQEKIEAPFHSTKLEASLSVNSHYQKRKKMADFQLHSCTKDYSDFPLEESSSMSDDENMIPPKDPYTGNNDSAQKESLKLEQHESFSLSHDLQNVKKVHICCSSCRCSLGLHENHFLVPCSFVRSSKFRSSFDPENGPNVKPPRSLLRFEQMKILVAITDIANVNKLVLSSHTHGRSPQPDVWSKDDGCVLRVLCCPFCGMSDNCLGLQIIATDASNTHLLNKVVFFADQLHIKDDARLKVEELSPAPLLVRGNGSGLMQIEQFANVQQPLNIKSKLRLHKRDPAI